jgi:hypothetical protein
MTALRTLECMSSRICADGDSAHMSAMRRRQHEAGPTTASSSALLQSDRNDDDGDSSDSSDEAMMTPHLWLHLLHVPHRHITCSHAIAFCHLQFRP